MESDHNPFSNLGEINFFKDKNAAYDSFAYTDKDALTLQMIQPGATGFGLYLTHMQTPECCTGSSEKWTNVLWDHDELWFLPVVIRWSSPVSNETFETDESLIEVYKEDDLVAEVIGPHVIMSEVLTDVGTHRWFWENGIKASDDYFMEAPVITVNGEDVYSVIPAWDVTPINEETATALIHEINQLVNQIHLHNIDICYCVADYTQINTAGGGYDYISGHTTNCTYVLGAPACSCGLEPTEVQLLDAFYEAAPSFIHETSPNYDLYKYAIERQQLGWAWAIRLNDEIINRLGAQYCFTWYLRAHSPFSPFSGPKTLTAEQSPSFTNSETQQAS